MSQPAHPHAPASDPAPVREGEVLGGKFRVDKVLGWGGMGVVVAATHLQLDQKVALKFLLPQALGNTELVSRFAREARAAARIKSEHVVRVLDVGNLPDGAPFMVMEYLDGSDLAQTVRRNGALSVAVAVDFMVQACEAIAEAHAAGIVHRDLKPANLFLARGGDGTPVVKVLDFGISKMALGGDDGMTRTTAMMGSPLYMSPEHLQSSRDVDQRTDLWALGIILHEMLAGSVPFSADTMPQLCVKIMNEPPAPIRVVRPDVPVEIENAILRCLERDRSRRFPTAADLALALAPFGSPKTQLLAEKVTRIAYPAGHPTGAHAPVSLPIPSVPLAATGPHAPLSASLASAPTALGTSQPGSMPAITGFSGAQTTPPAPKASRAGLFVGLAALAVAGVGAAWFFTRAPAPTPKQASEPAANATQTAASQPAPSAANGTSVAIHLSVEPKEAKIFVDDAEVSSNPYDAKIKPDGSGHKVRFEAPGFEPQSHYVVYDKAVSLDVKLAQKAVAAPQPAPPAPLGGGAPAAKAKPKSKLYTDPF
jgi:serine/threonine-protein kinase